MDAENGFVGLRWGRSWNGDEAMDLDLGLGVVWGMREGRLWVRCTTWEGRKFKVRGYGWGRQAKDVNTRRRGLEKGNRVVVIPERWRWLCLQGVQVWQIVGLRT